MHPPITLTRHPHQSVRLPPFLRALAAEASEVTVRIATGANARKNADDEEHCSSARGSSEPPLRGYHSAAQAGGADRRASRANGGPHASGAFWGLHHPGLNPPTLPLSAAQYKAVKPVGDRVFVKVDKEEARSVGGVLLPSSAQQKSTAGTIVALGDVSQVKVGHHYNYPLGGSHASQGWWVRTHQCYTPCAHHCARDPLRGAALPGKPQWCRRQQ